MKKVTSTITVQNRKHSYTLSQKRGRVTYVECLSAGVSQNFPSEDVPALLIDLPNLIIAEKEHNKRHSEIIRFRVSDKDKKEIEKRAMKNGFNSISEYMRDVALG